MILSLVDIDAGERVRELNCLYAQPEAGRQARHHFIEADDPQRDRDEHRRAKQGQDAPGFLAILLDRPPQLDCRTDVRRFEREDFPRSPAGRLAGEPSCP